VLHRIVEALVGAGLDIRTAIVSTIGADVVDSFYVRTPKGPLLDAAAREALREAVLKALGADRDPAGRSEASAGLRPSIG
jgi:[protein-PII] uridylyltransferase